jgi:hypothetical protein
VVAAREYLEQRRVAPVTRGFAHAERVHAVVHPPVERMLGLLHTGRAVERDAGRGERSLARPAPVGRGPLGRTVDTDDRRCDLLEHGAELARRAAHGIGRERAIGVQCDDVERAQPDVDAERDGHACRATRRPHNTIGSCRGRRLYAMARSRAERSRQS